MSGAAREIRDAPARYKGCAVGISLDMVRGAG